MNRRHAIQTLGGALGSLAGAPLSQASGLLSSGLSLASPSSPIKRVVFFLQNQGFDPATAVPAGLNESGSLDGLTLPTPISPLEEIKDKLHIITGLHGHHTSPAHSAYFGALGGYRGGIGIPARRETIDYTISKLLPETVLPHLCIGMDSLENMNSRPTLATLSARGAGQPIFMHSNPQSLYQMLFGSIASGDIKQRYEARSQMFDRIEELANKGAKSLPDAEKLRYQNYVDAFKDMNGLRDKLAGISDHLAQFAPEYSKKFTEPEYETDWHDSLLDLGLASLKSGITNTLTIGSGRGEIFGSWKGLGVTKTGHNLGHMEQPDNDIWVKIRQYNSRMLVKLVRELESVPEGEGNMMDNTLIVYTSNNADKQHTRGSEWPFMLIGNTGGVLKTGHYTKLDGSRPINALYTTLLHAIGSPRDRYNMDKNFAEKYDRAVGPIEHILS